MRTGSPPRYVIASRSLAFVKHRLAPLDGVLKADGLLQTRASPSCTPLAFAKHNSPRLTGCWKQAVSRSHLTKIHYGVFLC